MKLPLLDGDPPLTGHTRLRVDWRGRLIVQVEYEQAGSRWWRDAAVSDLDLTHMEER